MRREVVVDPARVGNLDPQPAPRMAQFGWVRCDADGIASMRRGAWYEVLERVDQDRFAVMVNGRRVTLDSSRVTHRTDRPSQWSVVTRSGVMRPTWSGQSDELVTSYAVCPNCAYRMDLAPGAPALRCESCSLTAPVDWSQTC